MKQFGWNTLENPSELVNMLKKWIFLFVVAALFAASAAPGMAFETREELREAYWALSGFDGDTPYAQLPQVSAPHSAGSLDPAAVQDALDYLNFLRAVAGLEPVELSRIYAERCQRGAVLLAALDYADHNAPQPADMDDGFYESAHLATASSNLARFNWMRPTILRDGVEYFARDDGDANLATLGHRRWLLNPAMSATGFGLANSESGMSYVVMYAHDFGNEDAEWSEVCWPSAGAFPVQLMHADLAWSVSLNPEVYDVANSDISVTLEEESLGLRFSFDCSAGSGDGFCTVNFDAYGSGPCVIFRPDFSETDFTDYLQNQRWTVRVSGLVTADGEAAEIAYAVEMASLYAQDVASIELSALELNLSAGETARLTASAIPSYADDLSVTWSSSDPAVATVDETGLVTAVAPGTCEIAAQSTNGREDRCEVRVE